MSSSPPVGPTLLLHAGTAKEVAAKSRSSILFMGAPLRGNFFGLDPDIHCRFKRLESSSIAVELEWVVRGAAGIGRHVDGTHIGGGEVDQCIGGVAVHRHR